MLSMALRVGQALCLHMAVPPFQVSPFEQQLRRRTWQAIGVLDLAAALDRAFEPMMQSAWLDHVLPANINDEDIWHGMDVPFKTHPEGTFTDMTQTSIIAAAQSVARSIGFTDFIEPTVRSSQKRQEVLANFRKTANTLLAGCRPEISSYHLYVSRLALTIFGWLQLGWVAGLGVLAVAVPAPPIQTPTMEGIPHEPHLSRALSHHAPAAGSGRHADQVPRRLRRAGDVVHHELRLAGVPGRRADSGRRRPRPLLGGLGRGPADRPVVAQAGVPP